MEVRLAETNGFQKSLQFLQYILFSKSPIRQAISNFWWAAKFLSSLILTELYT